MMDELRARHVRREALYSQWDAPFCASCHQEWGDHGCDFIRADDERRKLLRLLGRTYALIPPDRLDLVDDEVNAALAALGKADRCKPYGNPHPNGEPCPDCLAYGYEDEGEAMTDELRRRHAPVRFWDCPGSCLGHDERLDKHSDFVRAALDEVKPDGDL